MNTDFSQIQVLHTDVVLVSKTIFNYSFHNVVDLIYEFSSIMINFVEKSTLTRGRKII